MLENIVEHFRNSDGLTKKKILGCIFSKKLVLEKGKIATFEFTIPIKVLLNTSKVLISLKLIDFKGVRCNSPQKTGIRFKNPGTKRDLMTSCPVWLPCPGNSG